MLIRGKLSNCLFFIVMCLLLMSPFAFESYGMAVDGLPDNVCRVDDERELVKDFVAGLRKHKSNFSYYYPGIEKYFKSSGQRGYSDFFKMVADMDGYAEGTISGYCILVCGDSVRYVTIQVGYLTTKKQEKKIDSKVKKIVRQIGKGSRKTKIRKAHDYLVGSMRYDNRYYSPYDAFTKGRGMCMAYALSFQRLMQEMNIPCKYIKGDEHAWNMVKLGGKWYLVDVTFDDSSSSYRYFLK